MKANQLIIGIALLLSAYSATAQEAMLSKAKTFLNTSKGLQIEYRITIGDDSETGSYYALNSAFYLESASIKAWYSSGNLWVYLPQNAEVNLTSPLKEDLLELNPLLNLNRISSKNFQLKELTSGAITIIKATPKQPEEVEWLEVTLNEQGKPMSLRIKQRSLMLPVDLVVTKLVQATTKEMKQKSFFTYQANKLPGVEVIDLR